MRERGGRKEERRGGRKGEGEELPFVSASMFIKVIWIRFMNPWKQMRIYNHDYETHNQCNHDNTPGSQDVSMHV